MGLDLGDKTLGVALSDPMGWTAQGLEVIRREGNTEREMKRLREIVSQYEVEKIIVGLPKNMNGTLGERAEKSKAFAFRLQEYFSLPVEMWDERLSTVAAEKILLEGDTSRARRKKVIDKLAAAIILQGYLDAKSNNS